MNLLTMIANPIIFQLNLMLHTTNQKFTNDKVTCLLDVIEDVFPLDRPIWHQNAEVYNFNTTKHHHSMENIRCKWNNMHRTNGETEAPHLPPEIQGVQKIKHGVISCAKTVVIGNTSRDYKTEVPS
jgi:hypothetical protein